MYLMYLMYPFHLMHLFHDFLYFCDLINKTCPDHDNNRP